MFQASLLEVGGAPAVVVNSAGTILTITDKSNYASDGGITDELYFTGARKIKITLPDGSTTYVMASYGTRDETISTASVGIMEFDYTATGGSGNYIIQLTSVPTWISGLGSNYATGDIVYYSGSFYQRNSVSYTGDNPSSTENWTP